MLCRLPGSGSGTGKSLEVADSSEVPLEPKAEQAGANHVKIWEKEFQEEVIAAAKALIQKYICCVQEQCRVQCAGSIMSKGMLWPP